MSRANNDGEGQGGSPGADVHEYSAIDKFDLFLSYKDAEDGVNAARLRDILVDRWHLKVFFAPRNIAASEAINDQIEDALQSAGFFVAWFSKHYLTSQSCLMELAGALSRFAMARTGTEKQRILVINPHSSSEHIHPAWLRGIKFWNVSDSDRVFASLAEEIAKAVLNTDRPKPPPIAEGPEDLQWFGVRPTIQPEELAIGRESELFAIFDAFHSHQAATVVNRISSQPAVIWGPSGAGKSHLIQSYARQFARLYPGGVYWFDCSRLASASNDWLQQLDFQMRFLLNQKGFDLKAEAGTLAEETGLLRNMLLRKAKLSQILPSRVPFLWIVENLPSEAFEPGVRSAWVAPNAAGLTLVSSLTAPASDGVVRCKVGLLAKEVIERAIARALRRNQATADAPIIGDLARRSAGLPSMIRPLVANFAYFGPAFATRDSDDLEPMLAAYRPLIELCNDKERQILSGLLLLGEGRAPLPLVQRLGESFSEGAAGAWKDALRILDGRALITLSANGVQLEAPIALLKDELSDRLNPERTRQCVVEALVDLLPTNVRANMTGDIAAYVERARRVRTPIDSPTAAILLQRLGTIAALIGDTGEEQILYGKAYRWFRQNLGETDSQTLEALMELAQAHKKSPEELRLVEKGLSDSRRASPEHRRWIVTFLRMRAVCLQYKHQSREALETSEQAIRLAEEVLPQNDELLIQVFASHALFLGDVGRVKEARALEERLAETAASTFGVNHQLTLRINANLAAKLEAREWPRRMAIERSVLKAQATSFGRRNYLTTWAASNLFGTLCDAGQWREARTVFLVYLGWLSRPSIRPKIHTQPDTGRDLSERVAWIERQYATMGRGLSSPRTAEESFERALLFMTMVHFLRGPGAPSMTMMLADCISALFRLGESEFDRPLRRFGARWRLATSGLQRLSKEQNSCLRQVQRLERRFQRRPSRLHIVARRIVDFWRIKSRDP
jgi:tetratricopeptide (TPR) repeat protein